MSINVTKHVFLYIVIFIPWFFMNMKYYLILFAFRVSFYGISIIKWVLLLTCQNPVFVCVKGFWKVNRTRLDSYQRCILRLTQMGKIVSLLFFLSCFAEDLTNTISIFIHNHRRCFRHFEHLCQKKKKNRIPINVIKLIVMRTWKVRDIRHFVPGYFVLNINLLFPPKLWIFSKPHTIC